MSAGKLWNHLSVLYPRLCAVAAPYCFLSMEVNEKSILESERPWHQPRRFDANTQQRDNTLDPSKDGPRQRIGGVRK